MRLYIGLNTVRHRLSLIYSDSLVKLECKLRMLLEESRHSEWLPKGSSHSDAYSITRTAKSDLPTRSTIAYKTAAFSGCNLTHPEDAGVPSLPI